MKYLIFYLTCLVTPCIMNAQPVIPLDWAPEPGGEWKQRLLLQAESPGEAGAQVTWDFSEINVNAADGEIIFHWIDPESTQYRDSFPESTVCADLELSGFGRGFSYGYYARTQEGFEYLGSGNEYLTEVYKDPQTLRHIGLEFTQTAEDDYHGLRHSTFTGTEEFSGMTSYHYDGYGTLILPEATIPNTIRVFQNDVEKDSSGSEMLYSILLDSITTYAWVANGSIFPVVQWQRSVSYSRQYLNGEIFIEEIEGPDTSFSVNPDYAMISGIGSVPALPAFVLYPTVAKDEIRVELSEPGSFEYTIHGLSGNYITGGTLSSHSILSVGELAAGVYTLRVDGHSPGVFVRQ